VFVAAQGEKATGFQVKAVFLFNFTQFVEWPEGSFLSQDSPFVIGVVGVDPFGEFLDETVAGEHVSGHPVAVRRYDTLPDSLACHILYMNLAGRKQTETAITMIKGRSGILTVGESDGFIELGGMIRFVRDRNRVRFQVNQDVAESEGLVISSKLLRLAEIVRLK
jgi:hypothetical protein